MHLTHDAIATMSRRLFWAAGIVYLVSLLSQTVLMSLAFHPAVASYSAPLASVLGFLVLQLQSLALPPVATLCLILGIVLRATLKDAEAAQPGHTFEHVVQHDRL